MIGNLVDSVVGVFAPAAALRRMQARATMKQISAFSGGSSVGGHKAGKLNRMTKSHQPGSTSENAQPRADIVRMRALSWDLYRNNPQARKICRSLESKVIGRGMRLQSQATRPDGTAHVEFRTRVRVLWNLVQTKLDYRGQPGQGGQLFSDLCKTALRACVLSGESLYRFRTGVRIGSMPTTKMQLIHADRLVDTLLVDPAKIAGSYFFGIELDQEERRIAYHLSKYHPNDPRGSGENNVVRVEADQIGHLYIADDIDQLRGVPWFGPVLLKNQETSDYEYSELKAAAVAACVVLGYRRSSGQNAFGLQQPDDWDLTDQDGNKMTAMQPGMLMDLGRTGEIQGFNPMRPNSNASEFINHMVRSQAAGVPGTKGSTLTGDYRNSSFSSERSADNDVWPEIEGVQDWFASNFCHPIYERVVFSAVLNGWFADLVNLDDFVARKDDYLAATWHGPVGRSINPTDDAKAARLRVQNGQSSPQIEAALLGRDWQEIVRDVDEYLLFCEENDIPDSVIAQTLGIDQQDQPLEEAEDKEANKEEED